VTGAPHFSNNRGGNSTQSSDVYRGDQEFAIEIEAQTLLKGARAE
jgi:hypothetical protein